MEALIKEQNKARLLKIDIDKWGSPVATQYKIQRLPTVWLYQGKRRVETDTGKIMARLKKGLF